MAAGGVSTEELELGVENDTTPSLFSDGRARQPVVLDVGRGEGRAQESPNNGALKASGPGNNKYPGTLTEYHKRLSTYITWPQSTGQYPGDLADNGFYYTGEEDRVVCQYCELELYAWKPTDLPSEEHRKFNPDCKYIKQFQ